MVDRERTSGAQDGKTCHADASCGCRCAGADGRHERHTITWQCRGRTRRRRCICVRLRGHRGRAAATRQVPRQGAAGGQHGVVLRVHAAVRGAASAVGALRGQGAGGDRRAVQRFRRAGAQGRERDPGLLQGRLQRHVPPHHQAGGARTGRMRSMPGRARRWAGRRRRNGTSTSTWWAATASWWRASARPSSRCRPCSPAPSTRRWPSRAISLFAGGTVRGRAGFCSWPARCTSCPTICSTRFPTG